MMAGLSLHVSHYTRKTSRDMPQAVERKLVCAPKVMNKSH